MPHQCEEGVNVLAGIRSDYVGLILSVAALIGAFPLSLLANLATPSIRNWWAERSISSLGRRIVALERELEEIEKTPVISDGEERILRALTWLGFILMQMVGFFLLIVSTLLLPKMNGNVDDKITGWGGIVLAGAIFGAQASIIVPTLEFLRRRSRTSRERMGNQIKVLRARLAGRT